MQCNTKLVGQETDNGVFVVTSDNQRHCVRITEVERDKHSVRVSF